MNIIPAAQPHRAVSTAADSRPSSFLEALSNCCDDATQTPWLRSHYSERCVFVLCVDVQVELPCRVKVNYHLTAVNLDPALFCWLRSCQPPPLKSAGWRRWRWSGCGGLMSIQSYYCLLFVVAADVEILIVSINLKCLSRWFGADSA